MSLHRHCEERSDEAIQLCVCGRKAGLLRFARNDDERLRGSLHLAPLAGRGRIASSDAIRVRGYRSIDGAPGWREPLTPNLSPQERGEGELTPAPPRARTPLRPACRNSAPA